MHVIELSTLLQGFQTIGSKFEHLDLSIYYSLAVDDNQHFSSNK